MIDSGALFKNLPEPGARPEPDEDATDLLSQPGIRIERIVSTGQSTREGVWLTQDMAEWVVLLTGSATLRFEGEPEARHLRPGDWVAIPAGRRHRVDWTPANEPSVWLAVHYGQPAQKSGP